MTAKTLKLVNTTFGFTDEENNVFSKHVVNVILNSQADELRDIILKADLFLFKLFTK